MTEDVTGDIEKTADSHDEPAAPSTATDTQGTQPEGSATEQSTQEGQTEKAKPNKVQERINQLTRQKHEERLRADDLEQRLKDLESKQQLESTQPEIKAPVESDFDEYGDFQAAQSKHIADSAAEVAYQRFSAERKITTDQERQATAKTELQGKQKKFLDNLEGKRANFQDFDEVAYGHNFMDQGIAEMIFESEKGPEVAYHLGSNLDEAERIFSLPPLKRARELALLEVKLEGIKPKLVSDAPDPINPLGGTDVTHKDPDSMSTDDWLTWRRAQLNK